jgi:chromosome segregation ATPase
MGKPIPTLLALALALALPMAATSAQAQQITTSKGVRNMPPIRGMYEAQLREAVRAGEDAVSQLLSDVNTAEKSLGAVTTDVSGYSEQIKQTNAELERAKAAFDEKDQRYKSELAAFDQRQQALAAEIERQRAAAAPVEALPSAQRDIQEVFRLNEWAAKNDKERAALATENTRLLAEHASVEEERAKLAKMGADADAALKSRREKLVGQAGGATETRNSSYAQLRIAVSYLGEAYAALNKVARVRVEPSSAYNAATAKLRAGH